MESGVYKITCLSNCKIYIGSSKNIKNRIKNHVYRLNKNNHVNPHLQNAWNLYGDNSFIFETLEFCEEEKLLEREQYYMDLTKCFDKEIGFNNCFKSDRPLGYKHTLENRLKMSFIKKEQLKLGLIKCNLIRKEKGYKHSEETKNKIRETKIGDKNPMYGKKLSDEQKKIKGEKLNSVPRWNKGLTKTSDKRLEKLAVWKNKLPPNAISHKLVNKETNEQWEENSLKHLSKVSPLSMATLNRLKKGKAGKKITQKYELTW